MSSRRTLRGGSVLGLALLALGACGGGGPAGGSDKFATARFSGPPAIASPGLPANAAVAAFSEICSRLDPAEAIRRAAGFGFAPVDTRRLPLALPEALREPGLTLLARTPPGAPVSLVFLSETGPTCEMALGGVDSAAVEREFLGMLAGLSGNADLLVREVDPAIDRETGSLRLRRAAVVLPRVPSPALPPRGLALRVNEDPGQPLRVALVARVLRTEAEGGRDGTAPALATLGGPPKR